MRKGEGNPLLKSKMSKRSVFKRDPKKDDAEYVQNIDPSFDDEDEKHDLDPSAAYHDLITSKMTHQNYAISLDGKQRRLSHQFVGLAKHSGTLSENVVELTKNESSSKQKSRKLSWFYHLMELTGLYNNEAMQFKLKERLDAQQSIEHSDPKFIFFALINDQAIQLKELLAAQPNLITNTDAVGGNIIHCAYLYEKYELGRYLVENFPEVALAGYSDQSTVANVDPLDMPYTGETILHVCIVKRNAVEVRWLLDFYRDRQGVIFSKVKRTSGLRMLLESKVKGTFFMKDKHYFGETPLHFAACTNDIELFDLVLSYVTSEDPDALFLRDSRGNNLLHITVLRDLPDMFAHIKSIAEEAIKSRIKTSYSNEVNRRNGLTSPESVEKQASFTFLFRDIYKDLADHGISHKLSRIPFPSPNDFNNFDDWVKTHVKQKISEMLLKSLNNDLLTPCGLAAYLGKASMLEFLLKEYCEFRWRYGPLSMYNISIEDFDMPIDADRYTMPVNRRLFATIEWLCKRKHTDCFAIPVVESIIVTKWKRIGRPALLLSAAVSTVITALVTIILVMSVYRPHFDSSDSHVVFASCLYFVAGALIFYRLVWEIPPFFKYGFGYVRGAPIIDKICTFLTGISFLTLCIVRGLVPAAATDMDDTYTPVDYQKAVQVSLIVCAMSCYTHFYYYLMSFDMTGPFLLTLYKIVSNDVPFFIVFYVILVLSIGCSLALLTNAGNHSISSAFAHVVQSWWELVRISAQLPDDFNTDYVIEGLPWLYDGLRTMYSLAAIVLMFNLLVAMMTDTFIKYSQSAKNFLLMEKYNIMCAMQSYTNSRNLETYAIKDKVDTYIEGAGAVTKATVPNWYYALEDYDAAWTQHGTSKHSITASDSYEMSSKEALASEFDVKGRAVLLIVDPQVDFHDGGSLAVPGADQDAEKIATMIRSRATDIDEIYVTLDSHPKYHIGHAIFWEAGNGNGERPPPYHKLSLDEVLKEVWVPKDKSLYDYVKAYARALQARNKLQIVIWPEHCIIGSSGHAVVPVINAALQHWAAVNFKTVHYVRKGMNPLTEMYSALAAEVEDLADRTTTYDARLLGQLQNADKILICGQALSHTLNYTTRDLCSQIGNPKKLVVLTDATSCIPAYEASAKRFIADMKAAGVHFSTTREVFRTIAGASISRQSSFKSVGTPVSRQTSFKKSAVARSAASVVNYDWSILEDAFETLQQAENCADFAGLKEYLEALGVREAKDLTYIKLDELTAIQEFLKVVKRRAFASLLEEAGVYVH